jgi:hypothetical protein
MNLSQEAGRTYRLGILFPLPRDWPLFLPFFDALRHRGLKTQKVYRRRMDEVEVDRVARHQDRVPI